MRRFMCGLLAIALLAGASLSADDATSEGTATVVNSEGGEVKVTGLKFTAGTHRLAWLADPKGSTEDARKGPLAVEVREMQSTTFAKGVVTYVPVSSLESVTYDYDKKFVNFSIKGIKEPLKGTLQYKGLNVLNFDGSVDGKATKFIAGVPGKSGVKSITFAGAKELTEPKKGGTTWVIQIIQAAENPPLIVRNLKLLYHYTGGIEKLEDKIPVRKGESIPLNGTVKRLEILATDPNTNIAAAEIDTATATDKVIAIPLTQEADKRTGTLVGFVGEVDAGWKMFPLHTIKLITDLKRKVE